MWIVIAAALAAVLVGLSAVALAALAAWRSSRRLVAAVTRVTDRLSEAQVPPLRTPSGGGKRSLTGNVRWKSRPKGRDGNDPESTAAT